ncbi:endo-inulinase [Haloferula helveola]|uniref:Endo-inulinase n=2 Tax=Haloferula helveola TaxID=490095 RepID=A0ABM7R7B0_9BACT|nr:endo-inulinase [Haloferula helveola]
MVSCEKSSLEAEASDGESVVAHALDVSFNFDVRPILSDKCFFCHGPDVANNKGGLRLDRAEDAYAALTESEGFAIIPGDPDGSQLWHRVNSDDPEEVMPPPESKLELTSDEKQILRAWIEQGAEYEPHWAFVPLPAEVEVPEAGDGWASSELDRFVAAGMAPHGLEPSPPADGLIWLRRVTFDLTGLPPTVEEIEAFEDSGMDSASREAVVERLLSSPTYGERMATPWLDAARYADSYGYQSDNLSVSWPYRDWVVRAFNDNLPYDEFLTWNLAGDLLPDATRDQRLASGFNRLHRMTNEGGSIAEEFLVEYAADRLHTAGTAIYGLTMECSRCHDHKYDPITMRDYYGMLGFFNSIAENGLYSHAAVTPSPSLLLPTEAQETALTAARTRLAELEQATESIAKSREQAFADWLVLPAKEPVLPDLVGHFPFDVGNDNELPNVAPGAKQHAKRNGLPGAEGAKGGAVALNGDVGIVIPGFHKVDRWDAVTHSMWIYDGERNESPVVVLQRTYGTDVGYNGYDLMLENGHLSARWFRVWPGNAVGIRTKTAIPAKQWTQVTWTYDGSSSADGIRIYIDGSEVETELLADGPMKKKVGIGTYGRGDYTIGSRFRDLGFAGGRVDDFQVFSRALSPVEVADLHNGSSLASALAAGRADELRDYYLTAVDAEFRSHLGALREARKAVVDAEEGVVEVAVMEEIRPPKPTFILDRGEYDAPTGDPVPRIVPDFLPPMDDELPRDRLGLARWTTDPNHPLTARVFVNRMWKEFFGRGIVKSIENFGVQSDLPSHPELLDWLARDFVSNGWDVKRLCQQIVLSSTYGQSSRASADGLEKDPENVYLARGPSRRLSAEMIRDMALAGSGLLEDTRGGPPVSPYQPGGDLWRESNGMSPPFRQSTGKALHRRSLYSVWKRTAPLPNMMAFDATSREVCTVDRAQTNTPLQALVLLNDVQFVEASRKLAEEALADGTVEIDTLMLRWAGRPPDDQEKALLQELYDEQLEIFKADPEGAKKLLKSGESPAASDADPATLAAATVVAQAVLNLDATIWKR